MQTENWLKKVIVSENVIIFVSYILLSCYLKDILEIIEVVPDLRYFDFYIILDQDHCGCVRRPARGAMAIYIKIEGFQEQLICLVQHKSSYMGPEG